MSKVYGYCRLARKDDERMASELYHIRNYCIDKGLELSQYFYDNGVSAHTTNRDGLNRLLDVLEEGDVVVTKDISRLARNPKMGLALVDQICGMGAKIIYTDISEKDDDTSAIEDWLRSKLG